MPQILGQMAIGSVVTIKINDIAYEFAVAHKGRPSNIYDTSFDNGVVLVMKKLFRELFWNDTNEDDYARSDIHAYLNWDFLNKIDPLIRGRIKTVKIPYRYGIGYYENPERKIARTGANGLSCSVFLPSLAEVTGDDRAPNDGSIFSWFKDFPGEKVTGLIEGGGPRNWWMRTPDCSNEMGASAMYIWWNGGAISAANCSTSYWGVRPAMVLVADLIVTDSGELTTNAKPSIPSSISVPTTVKGGKTLTVSWGSASSASGYTLERSVNGGSWTQLYKGSALSYNDTITKGWNTVTYRVKSYGYLNVESAYKTSPTRTVQNNVAPSAPSSINVPTTVTGGKTLTVTWGTSTDADNNLSGYILERQYNGGNWAQLYKGSARTYTDTVTYGWNTVTYRVKAYDTENAQSGYTTSPTRTVFNNHTPTITGTDGGIGTYGDAAPVYSYTVADADNDTVTITEQLDGVTTRTYTATLGQAVTFPLTWRTILNGSHTIKITAADPHGASVTRTVTFTKAVTALELSITPMPADARPSKAVFGVQGAFPAGCILTVEACNNGGDAAPVWEDVTTAVQEGRRYYFENQLKTAAKWGVGLRVKLARGSASGDCYLQSISGNFE